MRITCGANGEDLDERQTSVCHHCGMPVCEKHGWVVASDDAFAGWAGPLPGAAPLPDEVPAMHCRTCVEKFHPGATKRRGWTDYGPGAAGYVGPAGQR